MTRAELLKVLDGMDISIPANTKLPNNALEKRLKQAIKASQSMASVISKIPLPLAELPKWPTNSDEHTVFRAIRRGDFREATMNIEGRLRGEDPFPLRVNPVIDVRQTLMTLAKNWDRGSKFAIMQDIQTETCAINIRVCELLVHITRRASDRVHVHTDSRCVQAQRRHPTSVGVVSTYHKGQSLARNQLGP